MDKEREIEEISDIIDDTVCIDYRRSRYDCLIGSKTAAKCIIEAGYRKADEVRKETAKEILFALLDKKFEMDDKGRVCIVDIYDELNRLFGKYGVEVDE